MLFRSQGAFPLIFILLFFSSAFFPRETMSGTYRKIADINPISHLVEGLRDMVLHQVTMGSIAKAILIPIAVCIAATMLALGALLAASKRPALLARMHEPVALHGFLVRIGAVVSSESVALARPIRQAGDATIAT